MKQSDRPKDGSDRLPEHLDPYRISGKPPLRSMGMVILVVAAISALVTAGVIQLVNREFGSEASRGQDDIKLISVSQQLAVVLASAEGRREIKLLDTQSLIVQDITRGQPTALTAALSPDGKRLAFMSDSPDGATVSVVEVEGGKPLSLAALTVLTAGKAVNFDHFAVCNWTNISWSTDNARFLVFGCDKDESAVIIVDADQPLDLMVLANTRATQEGPREAIWLNDHEILFSQRNDSTGQTSLKKISADTQSHPVLIYGK